MKRYADFIADEEAKAAAAPASKTYAELIAEEESKAAKTSAQPTIPVAPTAETNRATALATTPQEGLVEKARNAALEQVEKFDPEAAGYGSLRGGTLGASDRLSGVGAWLADKSGLVPGGPDPNAFGDERKRYLAYEDKKRKESPVSYGAGEVLGGMVPTLAAAPLSLGSKATTAARFAAPTLTGRQLLMEAIKHPSAAIGAAAESPVGRLAAQNFAAGVLNERSDDAGEQLKSGINSLAIGAGVGAASDATVGKAFSGAVEREGKSLVKDIMVSESGAAATPTARKQLVQKLAGATKELRGDPVLANAVRTDSASAKKIVQSKVQALSEPRAGLYQQLDEAVPPLTLADLHSGTFKAMQEASTLKEREVLAKFGDELNTFWIPKWEREGMLKSQLGKPMAVDSRAVREWTTKAQEAAADAMGTIDPTRAKKLQGYMAETAEDIWRGHLAKAQSQSPDVVRAIREYDGRVSSLLSMEKVLSQRATKEGEAHLGIGKKVENAMRPVGWGIGAAYALEHPGQAAMGVAAMEAARLRQPVGRYINDKLLVPLQVAAEQGSSLAELTQKAAQTGLPQSIARAVYERANQHFENAEAPPNPAATARGISTKVW